MQPYGQHPMQPGYAQQPTPMQPYGLQPGYGPVPINIVVQNTTNAGYGGGLVRVSNRNRGTAAVLALFLGGLGIHKFYLGQTVVGVLYLCLCWTFLPAIAGFFEGIGLLLSTDHAFDIKYNARLT